MEVKHSASQPTSKGRTSTSAEMSVSRRFSRVRVRRAMSCACVTFGARARSAWHTHPCGQTLIVTEGRGFMQSWGGPIQAIGPGDVIWTPPGE